MTAKDILDKTARFWAYHSHCKCMHICTLLPRCNSVRGLDVNVRDTAAWTIITIHWNLCMGTIARFAHGRPDLHKILDDLQAFRVCGEFMLTEISHGLDAKSIETVAALRTDGSFDLHTPRLGAAKAMPPTTLCPELPRIGVVFARLLIDENDHGIRPFLVPLSHADAMCQGVSSKALPQRPGAKHLDHAITSFDHVHVPANMILGTLDKPKDLRQHFFRQIGRVAVGTLALSQLWAPTLMLAGHIVHEYSKHRKVKGPTLVGSVPIISFRTQVQPIILSLCVAAVLENFGKWSTSVFVDLEKDDLRVQHGIATVFKTTATDLATPILDELIQRCGWQGLMPHNQIMELLLALRGNSIAEGDILVLCIRTLLYLLFHLCSGMLMILSGLGSELIQRKYHLPKPQTPCCLLARHEIGLMSEARSKMQQISLGHRSEGFNTHILPLCRGIVRAIGYRMAFEAAVKADVNPVMLAVYESVCIGQNLSWFVENGLNTREGFFDSYAQSITAAEPFLDEWLRANGAGPWITAPIAHADGGEGFLRGLSGLEGDSELGRGTKAEFVVQNVLDRRRRLHANL